MVALRLGEQLKHTNGHGVALSPHLGIELGIELGIDVGIVLGPDVGTR